MNSSHEPRQIPRRVVPVGDGLRLVPTEHRSNTLLDARVGEHREERASHRMVVDVEAVDLRRELGLDEVLPEVARDVMLLEIRAVGAREHGVGVPGVLMEKLEFQLITDQSGRSNAGLVYALLSLRLGAFAFPSDQWSDFIVVVLSWWVQASLRLLRGSSDKLDVRFMDGPFLVELTRSSPGVWHASFIEAGLQRRVRREANIVVTSFVRSLLETSEQALRLCEERGWWSSDADDLASDTTSLREEICKLASS